MTRAPWVACLGLALSIAGTATRPAAALEGAVPDSVDVHFVVTAPDGTPAAPLYVSGDPGLDGWSGRGFELVRSASGPWRGVKRFERGLAVEFKITRGSWNTVEKGPRGEEIGNRRFRAAPHETIQVNVAAWRDQVEGGAVARPSTRTGDIREHLAFAARAVRPRDVWVWLPPGYATSTRRYPVVYFHDGQNVFDRATAFIGEEWGADETAARLISQRRIPPSILVAIANTPERVDEYTSAPGGPRGGGHSRDYERFLVDELKPFIDTTYRTRPGPDDTVVIGSSLGALVSLDLGLRRPDVFRRVGCVSPAAWWADREIIRRLAAEKGTGLRIWLDIGTEESSAKEGGRKVWLEDARALRDALLGRGYRVGRDLAYLEVEGARHDERAWAARLDRILVFLLAGTRT